MKKMQPAGALIAMFQAVAVAPEAPCHPVVGGVALVPVETAVEGIRTRLVVAGAEEMEEVEGMEGMEETEETEEMAVLREQTHRGPRRPNKSWTPRWRIISTPMAAPQSLLRKLLRKLLHPAERPLRLFTSMILT